MFWNLNPPPLPPPMPYSRFSQYICRGGGHHLAEGGVGGGFNALFMPNLLSRLMYKGGGGPLTSRGGSNTPRSSSADGPAGRHPNAAHRRPQRAAGRPPSFTVGIAPDRIRRPRALHGAPCPPTEPLRRNCLGALSKSICEHMCQDCKIRVSG